MLQSGGAGQRVNTGFSEDEGKETTPMSTHLCAGGDHQ